jgi:hypothetical protein
VLDADDSLLHAGLDGSNTRKFECLDVFRMLATSAGTDLLLELRPQVQVGQQCKGVKAAQAGHDHWAQTLSKEMCLRKAKEIRHEAVGKSFIRNEAGQGEERCHSPRRNRKEDDLAEDGVSRREAGLELQEEVDQAAGDGNVSQGCGQVPALRGR